MSVHKILQMVSTLCFFVQFVTYQGIYGMSCCRDVDTQAKQWPAHFCVRMSQTHPIHQTSGKISMCDETSQSNITQELQKWLASYLSRWLWMIWSAVNDLNLEFVHYLFQKSLKFSSLVRLDNPGRTNITKICMACVATSVDDLDWSMNLLNTSRTTSTYLYVLSPSISTGHCIMSTISIWIRLITSLLVTGLRTCLLIKLGWSCWPICCLLRKVWISNSVTPQKAFVIVFLHQHLCIVK